MRESVYTWRCAVSTLSVSDISVDQLQYLGTHITSQSQSSLDDDDDDEDDTQVQSTSNTMNPAQQLISTNTALSTVVCVFYLVVLLLVCPRPSITYLKCMWHDVCCK